MITKRTWLFLIAAILTILPAIREHFEDRPVCVEDTRLLPPPPPRLVRVAAPAPRLLRVQDESTSPCRSTGYGAIVKLLTFASACLWGCFFLSLISDIQRYRRRHRKRRRSERRA